jgi:dienelactone hydrolase
MSEIALARIPYRHDGLALTGWLARPASPARGALVLFPTIANLTPAAEHRARMLAEAGYLVLIADFYGPVDAAKADWRALADDLRADPNHYRARLAAAVTTLRALPEAVGLRLGAVGYCMGGQAVLELARAGHDLAAVVSFHGLFETGKPAAAGAVKARILVCHGDADPMATRERVLAFWDEMDAAGANWHFHSYGGVRHGFTDPASDARGIPAVGYDASADRQSWAAMISLFDETFP